MENKLNEILKIVSSFYENINRPLRDYETFPMKIKNKLSIASELSKIKMLSVAEYPSWAIV